MARHNRKKRYTRYSRRSKRMSKRPIGFMKVKGKYRLVFGSKSKPRLGAKGFKTKKSLARHFVKKYRR